MKSIVDHFLWQPGKWMVTTFDERGGFSQAAALTYTTLLAIVPLMFVLFALLSVFPIFSELKGSIQHFIFSNFLPTSGSVVEQYVGQFLQQANKLPITSLVFLFVTAVMMMFTLDHAVQVLWRVRAKRQLGVSLLLYWAVLTLGPLLIGASIGVSSYLGSLNFLGEWHMSGLKRLWFLAPFVCAFLAFWFLYLVVPHCKVSWRHAGIGALFSACCFELAKRVFGWYLAHFPTYKLLYGTLATIPIFLLWVYTSWCIFIFGSLMVDGLRTRMILRKPVKQQDRFVVGLRVLSVCLGAQQQDQVLIQQALFDQCQDIDAYQLQQTITFLVGQQWLGVTQQGDYVLSCDLHHKSMADWLKLCQKSLPAELTPGPALPKLHQWLIAQHKVGQALLEVKLVDIL